MKSIIRVQHDKDCPYLTVAKATVNDTRLSLAERGFLLALLSLPDDWIFNVRGLASALQINKETASKHLTALVKAGYCRFQKDRKEGRFTATYTILERPGLEEESYQYGKTVPDRYGKTGTEKPYILNTNIQNSAGVPARQASPSPAKRKETPQSRSIALFFELYRKRTGKEAPWTRGKDHALLSRDLKRLGDGDVVLGEKRLAAELRALFEAPPPRMASLKYGAVSVFLPDIEAKAAATELAYSKRLRLLKTCKACGKASETTGIDCPKCGEPDAYQVREARHA
jgi:hypothetical protein